MYGLRRADGDDREDADYDEKRDPEQVRMAIGERACVWAVPVSGVELLGA